MTHCAIRASFKVLMVVPLPILVGLVVLAALGLVLGWALLARRRLHLRTDADEVHLVPCADGWRLALFRRRPRGEARGGPPVVLCHGLWANRFNMDFDRGLSLARHLAERGHDVFVVELRGSGWSARPGPDAGGDVEPPSFDVHVRLDAPAILERVREVTGAPQVFWVGHSMGGMVGYVLASGPLAGRIAGLVAVGSPAGFAAVAASARRVARLLGLVSRVALRPVVQLLAPLAGVLHPPLASLVLNPRNMRGAVERRALYNLVGELWPGHAEAFGGWIRTGRFTSADGTVDYLARLSEVRAPVYLLAGAADRLAPPASVRAAFEALGALDKRFEVLGPESGCRLPYGHGDLLVGRWAPEEVYPRISGWIEAREATLRKPGAILDGARSPRLE